LDAKHHANVFLEEMMSEAIEFDRPVERRLVHRASTVRVMAELTQDEAIIASGYGDALAHTIGHVALEQAWGEASADAVATLWTDEPARPIADAGERLGLRAGDDAEFRGSARRFITSWGV
jgi:hypothetical protein